MSSVFHEIEAQARSLPPEERVLLAESLLESLRQKEDEGVEADWEREIQARVTAFQRGEVELIDAETVFAELRQITQW